MGTETRRTDIETEFKPGKVAIAMTTSYPRWYPGEIQSIEDTDKVRGDLGLEMIRKAVGRGFNVVLADKDSPQDLRQQFSELAVRFISREDNDTRASGRKVAIGEASSIPEVKVIIRTEPEKISLLDFIPEIALPILRGEADIVVPKRRNQEFQTFYPPYMYESEVRANKKYNSILREFEILKEDEVDLDMYFGPTIISTDPQVISLYMERYKFKDKKVLKGGLRRYVRPDDFSNSQMFAVVEALNNGLKVVGVEIPFIYPKSQRNNEMTEIEEFRSKRKNQKWGILDELVLFIRYLRDPNSSKNVIEKED